MLFMNDFDRFKGHLKQQLEKPLPGLKAHELLMPEERKAMLKAKPDLTKARKAGVLLLFYPENNNTRIVFIERSKYDGVHSGQIAFPGGQYEKQDDDLLQTALRETEEEIGIKGETIKVIGKLSEIYIPPSNYIVLPVVGYINYKPIFIPEKSEVENVITFPIESFLKEDLIQHETIEIDSNLARNVPCFKVDGHIIWGATSMMLSELLNLLKNV